MRQKNGPSDQKKNIWISSFLFGMWLASARRLSALPVARRAAASRSGGTRLTPDAQSARKDETFMAWCRDKSILSSRVEIGHVTLDGVVRALLHRPQFLSPHPPPVISTLFSVSLFQSRCVYAWWCVWCPCGAWL